MLETFWKGNLVSKSVSDIVATRDNSTSKNLSMREFEGFDIDQNSYETEYTIMDVSRWCVLKCWLKVRNKRRKKCWNVWKT